MLQIVTPECLQATAMPTMQIGNDSLRKKTRRYKVLASNRNACEHSRESEPLSLLGACDHFHKLRSFSAYVMFAPLEVDRVLEFLEIPIF